MKHLISQLRRLPRLHRVARREDGFTMIAAIMILFVSSLLVTVTLVSAGGDIALTHNSINQKKAYYAALAGISAYQYNLNANSSYWKTCPSIPAQGSKETERTVAGTSHEATPEYYVVETLPSEEANGAKRSKAECESGKQSAIIQTSGSADGTFRIESTGTAGSGSEKVTRKLVATFSHPGFLNYVYLTNYEILDPTAQNPEPTDCEHYYKYRSEHHISDCVSIEFAPEDKVNGPLHTNDAAEICSSGTKKPTFGREGHKDKIEINGGRYAAGSCGDEWKMLGEFTEKGPTLTPPETDTEVSENAGKTFEGRTEIELKPTTPNTMEITNSEGKKTLEDVPSNGVIYVANKGSCSIKYSPFNTDTDYKTDQNCGDAYVHGEYTEQLTIAAQNDVIINGNIKTKTKNGNEPTGEGALGLIATNFVRIYHPVEQGYYTKNVVPSVEAAENNKCVTKYEYSGKVTRSSTEISNMSATTGLAVGAEVSGSGIESGTTISEIKASEKKIKLSKAAQFTPKEVSGTIGNKSTEIKELNNTSGLTAGEEVEGSGIVSGTTISEVKASESKIKLSKAAQTASEELSGTIGNKSTEVTGITTTKLKTGEEVEGSGIESGTTITEIGKTSEKKIKLSKAAKTALLKELSGKTTEGKVEVKEITTSGLEVGEEVEGSAIKAGTTISEIKASAKEIKLSEKATKSETGAKLKFYHSTETLKLKFAPTTEKVTLKFYPASETTTLKFYVPTGYEYNSTLNECHKVESGYSKYEASENRYIKSCESGSSYTGSGFCEYENNSNSCSSKAENETGSLENPIIDAAILSTAHSFIVDNYQCGKHLGELTVWGAIAQYWRGPVGEGEHGYTKNYNYDERLAYLQPPDFLTPTSSQLKLDRITSAG